MKKTIALILLFFSLAAFCGCSAQDDNRTIRLEQLGTLSEDTLNNHLTGIERETLIEAWGEPDGMLSGFWGDIFKIPDTDKQIILYYDENGTVASVKVIEQVKSE